MASLGAIGNLLLVLILSLYMVADRDHILSFLFRVVPPAYAEEARLLETSVARSFGGFLRGQALLGLSYALVAAGASAIFGLGYPAVTISVSGVLMAIPFFGPFVSWLPPVLVAIVLKPDVVLPTIAVMAAGWFVVMNVLQPRLMQQAVGIHPIVVLGSVLIGSKVGGIVGAIFGIPIAAVVSAFFFHYLGRTRSAGGVYPPGGRPARGARRARGPGPHEPPGVDPDVEPRDRARDHGPDPRADRAPVRRRQCRRRRRRAGEPAMTRERARVERRDLDKERGEPLAGGAARGGPGPSGRPPGRSTTGRPGRGSS